MRSWTLTALALGLAASVAACSGDRAAKPADSAARDSAAVGTSGANADRDFIQDQLEDAQAEIAISRVAVEKASNPQVKEFAQMMVRDHEKAAEALRTSASAANVQLQPMEPDHDHKNLEEDLSKLTGKDFDKKYVDAMVDEHQEAVNELEKKADTNNPQVREWVATTLPTVKQHLERAKQLKDTLDHAA